MPPNISIVITSYNRSRYLPQAIQSVLNQSYTDLELVVWDDGSTDGSLEVARTYADKDPRVTVIAGPHRGQSSALSAALSRTRGAYLGWLDDDDTLDPTALAETLVVMEAEPKVGMVCTDHELIDEQGKKIGPGTRSRMPYSSHKLLVNFMTFHFRLIRRKAYDDAGGVDPSVQYVADYDLCLRLSEITEIRQIPKVLYQYRIHSDRMSRERNLEMIYASEKIIRAALKRRKMEAEYELDVQLQGVYTLKHRGKKTT